MTMESSTAEAAECSNDRDTIAPNVDERPKDGGMVADAASQAMSALTSDEEDVANEPGKSIGSCQTIPGAMTLVDTG